MRGAGKGRGKGGNINLLFPFFLTAAILLCNERTTVVVARSKSKKPPTDTAFFCATRLLSQRGATERACRIPATSRASSSPQSVAISPNFPLPPPGAPSFLLSFALPRLLSCRGKSLEGSFSSLLFFSPLIFLSISLPHSPAVRPLSRSPPLSPPRPLSTTTTTWYQKSKPRNSSSAVGRERILGIYPLCACRPSSFLPFAADRPPFQRTPKARSACVICL